MDYWHEAKKVSYIDKYVNSYEYELEPYQGGFIFYDDETCDNKVGYWDYERKAIRDSSRVIYKGNKSSYKLHDSTLNFVDIFNKRSNKFKICKLTADTLILYRDSISFRYVKMRHHDDGKPLFDEVILYSSGCYGYCPINFISLKRNGEFVFHGLEYNTINYTFTSNIGKAKFDSVEMAFKKSTPLQLNNSYEDGPTDMSTTYIAFVKDGKIIKQISDYAYSSPVEFQNAYRSLQYLYQQVKIKSRIELPSVSRELYGEAYLTNNKYHPIILSSIEWFYLVNQLRKSPFSNKILKTKANSKAPNEIPKNYVVTDGRIFTLQYEKAKPISYDLGYNFFERNEKFIKRH
ncbi:DUF6438 domain-containing protein [Mucilaginibacter terrae]|uniref:DUF6438 domain-containing protein n=1 Tax=Mucilaginibacter terrae TaxID=1955052 RepID=UPI002896638C|nr:DUF6438 domain-containing protein [Mucilaginibacter terrae]